MIDGKTVFITGANRGIGEAAAKHFTSLGAKVVVAARNGEGAKAVADAILASGGQAIPVTCDVSDYQAFEDAVYMAVAEFGSLDVLINNAGVIEPIARIEESDPAEWGKVVDINLKGVYHGIRAVVPVMLKQGSGTIINLSSGAATGALEGWSHYCSTKAAVLSLTKCTHKEFADKGIRSVGLSPGTVATGMQVEIKDSGINPVSQLDPSVHISPEWVAKALEFLCTDAAREYDGDDFSLKSDEAKRLVGIEV